ncbi:MAG: sulfatase-like hydrolase/transferase [Dehalococcoidia bacterium]|nr:sulfatase-like hydrolase/transferase [Dehalococcoidia bacterium]
MAWPEGLSGQGLDPNQWESGDRAILELLTHPASAPATDFVATYRAGAYEAWAARGMIRFERAIAPDGRYQYRVVEQLGVNPIALQDARALATLAEEEEAARLSGHAGDDPNQRWVDPDHLTYPYAFERVAQLFDSPDGPDLVHNPLSYTFGRQPGQHGALDVIQSRAPLVFSGPGARRGETTEALCRQIDIAPTIARLMGFPSIDGRDATGRLSSERGVAPDVYFARQDGEPISEVLDGDGGRPERVYILLLDGVSHTELFNRLETEPGSLPALRRLVGGGTAFRYGSTANFPSITWPSHNALGTSCYGGHHGIVGPTYYLRPSRRVVTPQGQQFDTEVFLGPGVETIFEAFHRVFGSWTPGDSQPGALTASINGPCSRGADHASLEHRFIVGGDELDRNTMDFAVTPRPRWAADQNKHMKFYCAVDNSALGQAVTLFTDPSLPTPKLVHHEFAVPDAAGHDYGPHTAGFRDALDETDERVGRLLGVLDDLGLFDSTLFVLTSDHGMAAQDVSLAADPPMVLKEVGMSCVVTSPFIYLLDLDVRAARSPDGRHLMVTVIENDADESGRRPPVGGARVYFSARAGSLRAETATNKEGVAGLPVSVGMRSDDCVVTVRKDGFNERRLLASGESLAIDLRTLLYESATP